ncbi:THAP domain-containing protein 1-like [Malaya genurostris]|uniref:THAP domain-containing protein 1-like n=1 Tax=Malaya genurostris TaxID=325434 RepID=UPI0026F39937|nr:THAP domain-containing protein 1-like [Malaya genurostris]
MGKKYCSVRNCYNKCNLVELISMYRFPKNPEICEKWVEFCNKDVLNDVLVLRGTEALHTSAHYVCSDHFSKSCFNNPANTSQGLKKGSIPSILTKIPRLGATRKSLVLANSLTHQHTVKPTVSTPDERVEVFCPNCEEIEQFKSKFFEERFRAAELVKQYNEIQDKIKTIRAPYRDRHQALARIKSSTKRIKIKMKKLAVQKNIKINLSSDESSDDESDSS